MHVGANLELLRVAVGWRFRAAHRVLRRPLGSALGRRRRRRWRWWRRSWRSEKVGGCNQQKALVTGARATAAEARQVSWREQHAGGPSPLPVLGRGQQQGGRGAGAVQRAGRERGQLAVGPHAARVARHRLDLLVQEAAFRRTRVRRFAFALFADFLAEAEHDGGSGVRPRAADHLLLVGLTFPPALGLVDDVGEGEEEGGAKDGGSLDPFAWRIVGV